MFGKTTISLLFFDIFTPSQSLCEKIISEAFIENSFRWYHYASVTNDISAGHVLFEII